MKYYIVFLFAFTFCFGQNKDLETSSWNESVPIVWKNFKGKIDSNSDAAAQTASGISFGFSIGKTGGRITDFNTTVECLFYPSESWYKPDVVTPHILKHEQLHFDITELHARKFRQQITRVKPSSKLRTELNGLYKTISKASSQMQHKYDRETNHSIDKDQQAAWNLYIARELKKLEAYKTQ